MAGKEIAVKKYVVKLSAAERECLEMMVSAGKHPARKLTKARILLKEDAGEGWSDSKIAEAPDTSLPTIARTRQQLVEEGFEAVLRRKHSPASARRRKFDGAAEVKLIALASLFATAGRPRPMDVEPFRRQSGRTQHCSQCQRQYDWADAKKTFLNRTSKSNL